MMQVQTKKPGYLLRSYLPAAALLHEEVVAMGKIVDVLAVTSPA